MITPVEFERRERPWIEEHGLEFERSQDGRVVFSDGSTVHFTLRRVRDGFKKRFEMPIPPITTAPVMWKWMVKRWICDAAKEMAE